MLIHIHNNTASVKYKKSEIFKQFYFNILKWEIIFKQRKEKKYKFKRSGKNLDFFRKINVTFF